MFLQALGVILVLGSVLFLAYVTTRYIGNKTKRASKGSYIQVVETVGIGMDKQLHLVKVGEQFVLISTAGKSIQFMTDIRMEDYEPDKDAQGKPAAFDFKALFDKYVQSYRDRKSGKPAEKDAAGKKVEDMEGKTFKSNLGKLKSMTGRINQKGTIHEDEDTNEK